MGYLKPLSYNEIVQKYGQEKADRLAENPAQKFRMDTGIELVHPAVSKDDQIKLWMNWLEMSSEQKDISENKSKELFSLTNKDHHYKLLKEKWGHTPPFREEFLQILNRDAELTADDFLRFRRVVDTPLANGGFEVKENTHHIQTPFVLKKGDVINCKQDVNTTIGRCLVNRMIKTDPFGDLYDFEDGPVKINNHIKRVTADLIAGIVTEDQVIKMMNNAVWLARFAELGLPSMSRKILVTPPKSKELKEQLQIQHADLIKNGDVSYVAKVEEPVLKSIEEELKDDPSMIIFKSSSKPSTGNHLKQSIGTFSPIMDPSTGEYNIATSNLMDGHDLRYYNAMANMNIDGSYKRAVGTQVGGAMVKSIYNSMNHLKCAEHGTDCGTRLYKTAHIDKNNVQYYTWNYAVIGDDLVLLTPEVIKGYIGKTVQLRSVLFCNHPKKMELCNKCAGELPYRIGLTHIGNLVAKIGDTFLQSSLKAFHNSTIQLTNVPVLEYMSIVE